MPHSFTIDVNEVCRVEGHGNIHVAVKNNAIEYVRMGIHEGPRLFEAMFVGRKFQEVPKIVCRICAICSAHHDLTSIMALENALGGVRVSEQTKLLRELLFLGGQIESHYLHIFFLALPDFLGYDGAAAMAADYPEEVKLALKMKKLGNTIQELVGGRAIHPITTDIGGFSDVPSEKALMDLKTQLEEALEGSVKTADILAGIDYTDYYTDQDFKYLAVKPNHDDFGFMGDKIMDSNGGLNPVEKYKDYIREYVVDHSTAKQSLYNEKSFMVGAIARTNLLGDRLKNRAAEALKKLGLDEYSVNPIHNTPAQAVEGIYCIERCIEIIDALLEKGVKKEPQAGYEVVPGTGAAATEVPRGTLYHSYSINEKGIITAADVITPTAQNLANIEFHMRQTVRGTKDKSQQDIRMELEKLVRAYDPCISCSAHAVFLD